VPALVCALLHTSPRVSCVYGQSLVSTASTHTPHSSSRHSFSEGVCADTQLLGGAAVVNNIYVPPPRVLSSAVSRQVSAIIRRPVITPRVVLDPYAPSFQPRVAQLDPTLSVHSNPAALFGVIVDPLPNTDSPLPPTAFASSVRPSVPYSHPEPDEPKPPDIVHSRSGADAPVLFAVTNASVVGKDPKVPEHLRELFDKAVERSQLSPANQQYLADVLRRNSTAFATGPTQRSHEGRLLCAAREKRTRQFPRCQVLRHHRSLLGILADKNDGESQALFSFLHQARIIPVDANAFRSHQRAIHLLPPHGEHLPRSAV